jgi:hypothetical protein
MRKQDVLSFLASFFCLLSSTYAQSVTLYNNPGQEALGTGTETTSAPQESYTGLGAYDPLVLTPPPLPDPRPALEFGIQLNAEGQPGLSIPLLGNVLGFSVEMSVMDQVCESTLFLGCCATLLRIVLTLILDSWTKLVSVCVVGLVKLWQTLQHRNDFRSLIIRVLFHH